MAKTAELVDEIYRDYDYKQMGELSADVLQLLYGDIRVGSLSIPQIKAAMRYVCVGDTCEKSELIDLLREMDRRYFLIQDFRWEFSMLDTNRTNTITEEQTQWFVQMVYKEFFSNRRWEIFLRNRAVPGSGVTFAEIEVMLCNIPSKQQYYEDLEADRREREEWERNQREIERRLEEERRRKQELRDEERRRQDEEERRRQKELERRRREEESERLKKQNEREEYERRRQQMEADEERGRREAELRDREDRKRKEQEEKERQEKELMEAKRLRELQERQRQEEEERRRREREEATDLQVLYEEAKRKEKEAEEEAEEHLMRQKRAKDEASKKDALDSERRARLRARDYGNKKIRYALKIAIKKREKVLLVPAVDNFKKAKLPDDDLDLPKAEKILREFQARDGLKLAISSRQISALEKAINYVKIHGFEMLLTHELIEANKILLQLRRLERIRAEILELKQSTVAEIRSYQKPPHVVHVVMTGTFLLLGHKEKETKEWKTVQALVGKTGKDGLKRRCLGLEPHMMDVMTAKRAKMLMSDFDLDDVRDVSAGAATFYVWSWTMIEELEAQIAAKKEEEKKKEEMKKEKEEVKKADEQKETENKPEDEQKEESERTPAQAAGGGP